MRNSKVLQRVVFGESKLKNVIVCTVHLQSYSGSRSSLHNINGCHACLRNFSFYRVIFTDGQKRVGSRQLQNAGGVGKNGKWQSKNNRQIKGFFVPNPLFVRRGIFFFPVKNVLPVTLAESNRTPKSLQSKKGKRAGQLI